MSFNNIPFNSKIVKFRDNDNLIKLKTNRNHYKNKLILESKSVKMGNVKNNYYYYLIGSKIKRIKITQIEINNINMVFDEKLKIFNVPFTFYPIRHYTSVTNKELIKIKNRLPITKKIDEKIKSKKSTEKKKNIALKNLKRI